MSDLIERLQNGVVEHPKRWSGDTHYDLGGSVDYEATGELMDNAAQRILADAEALKAADETIDRMNCTTAIAHALSDGAIDDQYACIFEDILSEQNEGITAYRKARGGE